ncbi:MAG: hypothetical protein JJT75_06245 [Opitutales bacterium]|nr:hypothetical protein [Opitutales bacterium]
MMASSERRYLRAQIRRAKKGDRQAFLLVVEPYLDFLSEYLSLSGYAGRRQKRQQLIEDILRQTWRTLPFLHRVSDIERVLTQLLFQIEDGQDPILINDTYLPKLNVPERFALVAQDLEDWGYHWGSMALRKDSSTFGKILCEARCHLVGIYHASKESKTPVNVQRSSEALDLLSQQTHRRIKHHCSQDSFASQFKARWLEFRGHFIEFRQEVRFESNLKEKILSGLSQQLQTEEMHNPPLIEKLATFLAYGDQGLRSATPLSSKV